MHLSKNKILGFGLIVLSLFYPFIIYFFGGQVPGSYLIAGVLSVMLLRSFLARDKHLFYMSLLIAGLMLCLNVLNDSLAPMLYPVVMSLAIASMMGLSLIYPPSMIERFARITEPNLDSDGVRYTRTATKVWLAFGLINACISLFTVVLGDRTIWVLYNGCISYILMGLLLGGEYIVRHYYKAKLAK